MDDQEDAGVLAHAVARIGDLWALSADELLAIIGVPPTELARCRPGDPAFRRGQLLLALFTELDPFMGSNDAASRWWLRGANAEFGGAAPIDVMRTPDGLERVMRYAGWLRHAPC